MDNNIWLEELWHDFLPNDTITIGSKTVPLNLLKGKIRLFSHKISEKKRSIFTINKLIDFLVDMDIVESDDTIDENAYEDVTETLLRFIEQELPHILMTTKGKVLILKRKTVYNPEQKTKIKVNVYIPNLYLPYSIDLNYIKLTKNAESTIASFTIDGIIDEDIILNCDYVEIVKYLKRNYAEKFKVIEHLRWTLIVLNYGLIQEKKYEISFLTNKKARKYKNICLELNQKRNLQNQIFLSETEMEYVARYFLLINRASISNKQIYSALQRLCLSLKRDSIQDIIIDLVFALETALLNTKGSEISHRISHYSSYLISRNKTDIDSNLKLFIKAYEARSNIAHGNVDKIEKSITKLNLADLFHAIRRVIKASLLLLESNFNLKNIQKQILEDCINLVLILSDYQQISQRIPEKFKLEAIMRLEDHVMINIKKELRD